MKNTVVTLCNCCKLEHRVGVQDVQDVQDGIHMRGEEVGGGDGVS